MAARPQIVEQRKVLTAYEQSVINDPNLMTWRFPWQPGTYRQGTVTRVEEWTFVANKETSQDPNPTIVVPYMWLAPQVPSFQTIQYSSQAFTGVVLDNNQGRFFRVNRMRIWVGNLTQFYSPYYDIINLSRSAFFGTFLGSNLVDTPGWAEIPIGNELFIIPGDQIEFGVRIDNHAGATVFEYAWNYTGPSQNEIDPGAGNWNRNNQQSTFRISDTAGQGGGDAGPDLDTVVEGTSIRVRQQGVPANFWRYTVNSVTDNGGWRTFGVLLEEQGGTGPPPGGTDVQFTVPTGSGAFYEIQPDYFVGTDEIGGFLRSSGDITTKDSNLYNVDINAMEFELASDWDVLTIAGV